MLVECLLATLEKSCTFSNIVHAFDSTGIVPLNKEIPLESDYAMKTELQSSISDFNIYKVRHSKINNRYINRNHEEITELYRAEMKKYHHQPKMI